MQKSKEQKIRRLLDKFPVCHKIYIKFIFSFFNIKEIELVMDRTNWKLGEHNTNYLVLSILYNGISIPLYWLMLNNKGGASNSNDRIDLISWFITNFPEYKIKNLSADREFPSIAFLSWLITNKVPFIMRTKSSISVSSQNKKLSLKKCYALYMRDKDKLIKKKFRKIYNLDLYLSILKNERGELIYLISSQFIKDPFLEYKKRWHIEVMFSNYKIKGFNIESTKITDLKRLSTLFMFITISYVICCKLGTIRELIKPIERKKIIDPKTNIKRDTKLFTAFKYGFYLMQDLFSNYLNNNKRLSKQFMVLITMDIDEINFLNNKIIDLISVL